MPQLLEYEEEDLFGSGDEYSQDGPLANINTSVPIASPSRPATAGPSRLPPASPPPATTQTYPHISRSTGGPVKKSGDARLLELRAKRIPEKAAERERTGVRSLRSSCMAVIKANSLRIWDIGDVEYSLVKSFIDELPMNQLIEIENNSPHIKKDTDWLWEIFLLQDYRLFHDRCRERQGEPRVSGWRRMYRKAKEDAAERQLQAADRVAARYKQLEDEKKSKRIVVMDKVMPDKKPRGGGGGWGRSSSVGSRSVGSAGSRASSVGSSSKSSGASAIAKARQEAQRARVALTHASGRYVPPTQTKSAAQRLAERDTSLYKNPYISKHASPVPSAPDYAKPVSSVRMQSGRIPPPRSTATAPRAAAPSSPQRRRREASPPSSPIPGSYPSSQAAQVRAALPAHLAGRAGPSSAAAPEGRFRIEGDGKGKQRAFKEIKKPQAKNFEAPTLPSERRREHVDIFEELRPLGDQRKAVEKRKADEGTATERMLKRLAPSIADAGKKSSPSPAGASGSSQSGTAGRSQGSRDGQQRH
ncbi:hypothetical protein IAT38_000949 [Cryptococcus sp. DSM 104549]